MYKFIIIALCFCLPVVRGEGIIVGNVEWNSSGKALTGKEIIQTYLIEEEMKDESKEFATFHNATFISTEEKVGVKLEDPNNKVCFSPQEVQVYEDLQKRAPNLLDKGFANLIGYGYYNGQRALILSRLGLDLIDTIMEKDIPFYAWDELQLIATSAIDRIHFLHDTGYIHRDIKPANFMYGLEDPKKVDPKKNSRSSFENRIYLIDFGGSVEYRDANGTHYKQSKKLPYTTKTYPFCCRTHGRGLSQSRRDDMESLGYTLLICGGVRLPWSFENDTKKIVAKQNELCEELQVVVRSDYYSQSEMIDKRVQAAFSTYFYLLKQLFTVEDGFFREPDYDAFKKCFGENPQAHYLKVTGKKFDDAGVRKLMRRIANKLSSKGKAKQKK